MEGIAPGQMVGKYRVQGLLGETPWAITYVAFAHEGDEPAIIDAIQVALKVIAPHPGLSDALRKAREDVQSAPSDLVLAQIEEGEDAPPVGSDSGSGGDESAARSHALWSVSPLSSHPSLADLIDVCPLSGDEIVGFANRLALALSSLHERGLSHLAIKPTNIFVGPPPSHVVRIGDYGADALRLAAKTTHPWLAPEQLAIDAGAAGGAAHATAAGEGLAGPRADVFAMGLIIFFALTGSSYWSSPDDEKKVREEMRAPRLLPSLRARDVGVEIDASLDEVLLRALAASPDDRFASVRAFADALAVGGDAIMPDHAQLAQLAPEKKPAAAPASERHLKATKKLVRFELPKVIVSEPLPLAKRTVRIGKFDSPAAEGDEEQSAGAAHAGGDAGANILNLTARMAPASLPAGPPPPSSKPPAPPAPVDPTATVKAHPKFQLPAVSSAARPRPPPPGTIRLPGNVPLVAIVIAGIGVLVVLAVIFVVVLVLTMR